MSDKIIIHDNFYMGQIWRENDVPLGFITPDDGTSASIKRKQTVDSWVSSNQGYRSQIRINSANIKNELLSGFRLTKSQRRWTTSNVVWRVIDPRGFEIEISSENLMNLISDTTIINGEIMGRMIYGRMKASNVLLHESSEEYQLAKATTKLNSVKISLKDIKMGNKVILHDGRELVYMGRFYPIKRDSTETNKYIEEISVHSSKMTVFYDFAKNKILYAASTPKIGKISDTSVEYTQEEALAKICNLTTNESASIDTLTSWYSSYSVFGFTNKSKHSYRYEKMYFDIISANNDKTVHPSNKIFIEDGDDLYTVRYFHENMFNSHPNRYNDYMYKIDFDFGSNTMKYHTRIVNKGGAFRYNSYSSEQFITADWSKLSNPKAFYLKVSVVDTDLVYYFR